MNCEICTTDSSVDSIMWKCTGCARTFHAACVGVNVQRNSLRKKDKKVVDPSSYLVPCCESCQEHLHAKLEFAKLAEQQKQLAEQVHENTEVTHRFTLQQQNPRIIHEAVEGLEVLLVAIKNELSIINKTSSLAGSVVAIKNHVTSLFDAAMTATKDNVSTSLKTVTTDISSDLRNINNEMSQLHQLSLDIATSCNMRTNPVLQVDILDELKSLSANVASMRTAAHLPPPSDSYPSLEVELNGSKSGWRLLGTRKIWKADWTEYDARQLRRLDQQKKAEQARKRRKQNKSRNINYNDNSRNHRKNDNSSNSNNNNFNRNFHNNDSHHQNSGNHFTKHHNNRDLNFTRSHSHNNFLPPDRVLQPAAKDHFSRPPTNNLPIIQLQRGETLNPYPEDDTPHATQHINPMAFACSPTVLCEACRSHHTCFRR